MPESMQTALNSLMFPPARKVFCFLLKEAPVYFKQCFLAPRAAQNILLPIQTNDGNLEKTPNQIVMEGFHPFDPFLNLHIIHSSNN